MTLIKSISGIRGTIGGRTGDTLNPLDIVKFTTAYASFINGKKIVPKVYSFENVAVNGIADTYDYTGSVIAINYSLSYTKIIIRVLSSTFSRRASCWTSCTPRIIICVSRCY